MSLALLPLLLACSGGSSTSAPPTSTNRPAKPTPPADVSPGAAHAANDFGLDLWRRTPGGKNAAISPASLAVALTMTWAGAHGDTEAEMRHALHHLEPPKIVLPAWGKLIADLSAPERGARVRVANRLFPGVRYALLPTYTDAVAAAFGASPEPVDYAGDPEAARAHINEWVSGATDHRIKQVLPVGSVTGETRLVLVDAVTFDGKWRQPFAAEDTRPAPFTVAPGSVHDVATMHLFTHLRSIHADGATTVSLPYVGDDMELLVVLPDAVDGLAAVEAKLDDATIERWSAAMVGGETDLAMPRFTLPGEPLACKELLIAMGMGTAFDPDFADLTGISLPPRPEENLVLSDVFQQAMVRVDEAGTEGAAATAVVMPQAGGPPQEPKVIQVDHPFLFLIRDKKSGLVLFLGRVVNPG